MGRRQRIRRLSCSTQILSVSSPLVLAPCPPPLFSLLPLDALIAFFPPCSSPAAATPAIPSGAARSPPSAAWRPGEVRPSAPFPQHHLDVVSAPLPGTSAPPALSRAAPPLAVGFLPGSPAQGATVPFSSPTRRATTSSRSWSARCVLPAAPLSLLSLSLSRSPPPFQPPLPSPPLRHAGVTPRAPCGSAPPTRSPAPPCSRPPPLPRVTRPRPRPRGPGPGPMRPAMGWVMPPRCGLLCWCTRPPLPRAGTRLPKPQNRNDKRGGPFFWPDPPLGSCPALFPARRGFPPCVCVFFSLALFPLLAASKKRLGLPRFGPLAPRP